MWEAEEEERGRGQRKEGELGDGGKVGGGSLIRGERENRRKRSRRVGECEKRELKKVISRVKERGGWRRRKK